MTKGQAARLTALHRMQTYLDTNAADLGTISKSTSRTDLDTAVTGLEQLSPFGFYVTAVSTHTATIHCIC